MHISKVLFETQIFLGFFRSWYNFFWQFKVLDKRRLSKYSIKDIYLGRKDISLFFYFLRFFHREYWETISTVDLDDYYIEVCQKFAYYVYIKRVISNFCLNFLNRIYLFMLNRFVLSKVAFLFLPINYFIFFVCYYLFMLSKLLVHLVTSASFLFFKFVLYVWFDMGTRLIVSLYEVSWSYANKKLEQGSFFYALFCNFFFPFSNRCL